MKNNKGFTLAELLVVVAIIAILCSIAIPTFTKSLTAARQAVDDANLRSVKSMAMTAYLCDEIDVGTYLFDMKSGKFVADGTSVDPYGEAGDDQIIQIVISEDGTVSGSWLEEFT